MKLNLFCSIRPIAFGRAQKFHIAYHYLHRRANCQWAFGLFETATDSLLGVILYGQPASPNVAKGWCGKEERLNIIEITRLCILDTAPKFCESFLIANTIPLVPKEIIISYADTSMGHVGTVYQATNFLYCGLSQLHKYWMKNGVQVHPRTFTAQQKISSLTKDSGAAPYFGPQKHRYVFFNAKHKRLKELRAKLRYRVMSYPKRFAGEVSRYDTPVQQEG